MSVDEIAAMPLAATSAACADSSAASFRVQDAVVGRVVQADVADVVVAAGLVVLEGRRLEDGHRHGALDAWALLAGVDQGGLESHGPSVGRPGTVREAQCPGRSGDTGADAGERLLRHASAAALAGDAAAAARLRSGAGAALQEVAAAVAGGAAGEVQRLAGRRHAVAAVEQPALTGDAAAAAVWASVQVPHSSSLPQPSPAGPQSMPARRTSCGVHAVGLAALAGHAAAAAGLRRRAGAARRACCRSRRPPGRR